MSELFNVDSPGRGFAVAGLLAAALLGVYANHFSNEFHFDDSHTVQSNPAIRDPRNIPSFFTDARTFSILPDHQEYRPVVTTSLAVDYSLAGGLRPFWFHVSTFCWFLVQLSLMYLLFSRVVSPGVALFAVALYGMHPVPAETINYIVQRADLYSALGILAGLVLYVRCPGLRNRYLYLLPVAVAALAKVQAVMFAPLLALWIFLFEEQGEPASWRRVASRTWPSFAACALLFAVTRLMTAPSATLGGGPLAAYYASQPGAVLYYFTQFFVPVHLSADSGSNAVNVVIDSETVLGLLLLAGMAAAILLTARRETTRPVAFGLGWFLIGLLPTALVPLAESRNDHRMFLPFAGLTLAVGCVAARLCRSWLAPRLSLAAAVCLLLAFGWTTTRRNEVWRSEESLWRNVTEQTPRNGRGWMNFGLARLSKGDLEGASKAFDQASIYVPNYPLLEINLGIVQGAKGDDRSAEAHFQRARRLAPGDAQPDFYYARWLLARGRRAEALPLLEAAVKTNPGWPEPRQLLATAAETPEKLLEESLAHYRARRFEESLASARRALLLRPAYAEAYNNVGAANNELGHFDEAIAAFDAALRIRPGYPLALNNLAWAKRHKEAAQGRPAARIMSTVSGSRLQAR